MASKSPRVSRFTFPIALLLVTALAILWLVVELSPQAEAQSGDGWTEPMLLSTETYLPWFPDIAVDGDGRIHVVYDARDIPIGEGEAVPGIMYTVYQDGVWSTPNDLHVGKTGNIFRPAIAVDRMGNIHLTCSGKRYWRARVDTAYSAGAWYRHVLDKGISYISDVAVDSRGTVHVAYERWVMLEEPITRTSGSDVVGLADVFYRRSPDGGHTWSPLLNLSHSTYVGSHRVQLKVDAHDVIHVTWDEGWDKTSRYGEPREGVYVFSTGGGESWSEPTVFSQPESTNAQTAAASDDRGGVLVVWRATSVDNLFYAWSTDKGQTWSSPNEISGLYARSYNDTPFDAYDMATDSAGHIHLVAVGRMQLPANPAMHMPLGVYHLVWDGVSWSSLDPVAVYAQEEGFPEYPKIAISEGNRLHTVWFVRDQQFGGEHYRIFYSSSISDAPHQTPAPVPTVTPTPSPTPTSLPHPTSTPLPTLAADTSQPPQGLYTESDEVGRLVIALSPIVLLIVVIAVVKSRR